MPIDTFSQREREDAVNEIRMLASVQHHNILRYCEAFVENDKLHIVTEYAKRGDIGHKIKKRSEKRVHFSENRIWSYFIQMCRGLRALHRAKVLHRDLKPKNIFLTAADQVRLGDLGCAKLTKGRLARTQIGTPYYMSPEIWKHRGYNAKSDVWALGCILFELCQLRPPFMANDMDGLSRAVRTSPVPRVSSQYSKDLHSLIKKMLSKEPTYRPSMEEILNMKCVQDRAHLVPESVQEDGHYVGRESFNLAATIKVPRYVGARGRRKGRFNRINQNLPDARYPSRRGSRAHTSPAPKSKQCGGLGLVEKDPNKRSANSDPGKGGGKHGSKDDNALPKKYSHHGHGGKENGSKPRNLGKRRASAADCQKPLVTTPPKDHRHGARPYSSPAGLKLPGVKQMGYQHGHRGGGKPTYDARGHRVAAGKGRPPMPVGHGRDWRSKHGHGHGHGHHAAGHKNQYSRYGGNRQQAAGNYNRNYHIPTRPW